MRVADLSAGEEECRRALAERRGERPRSPLDRGEEEFRLREPELREEVELRLLRAEEEVAELVEEMVLSEVMEACGGCAGAVAAAAGGGDGGAGERGSSLPPLRHGRRGRCPARTGVSRYRSDPSNPLLRVRGEPPASGSRGGVWLACASSLSARDLQPGGGRGSRRRRASRCARAR